MICNNYLISLFNLVILIVLFLAKINNAHSGVDLQGILNSVEINDIEYNVIATADKTGNLRPNGTEYKFTVFLKSKNNKKIKEVEYFFVHPTFSNQHITVSDSSNNFPYSYIGWGCLTSVRVKVTLENGDFNTFSFNMCQKLGPDWRK